MSAIPPGAVTISPFSGPQLVPAVLMSRYFLPQSGGATNTDASGQTTTTAGPQFPPPLVWIEEQHHDQVVSTEHPVERGSPITDHAYSRPVEVTVRLGWGGALSSVDIQSIYLSILGFKESKTLFDIQTGKRQYQDMLIVEVSVMTDEKSEFVLMATLRCRQMLMVNTSVVNVPTGMSADPAKHVEPQKTAAPVETGPTPVRDAPNFNPRALQGIPGMPDLGTAGEIIPP